MDPPHRMHNDHMGALDDAGLQGCKAEVLLMLTAFSGPFNSQSFWGQIKDGYRGDSELKRV